MTKILIEMDGVDPAMAMDLVLNVIQAGKISEAAGVPHYCWATIFHTEKGDVVVSTKRKKPGQTSDSFKVYHTGE